MTITRNNEGSIIISDMVRDTFGHTRYIDRVYQGYTFREARRLFLDFLTESGLEVA